MTFEAQTRGADLGLPFFTDISGALDFPGAIRRNTSLFSFFFDDLNVLERLMRRNVLTMIFVGVSALVFTGCASGGGGSDENDAVSVSDVAAGDVAISTDGGVTSPDVVASDDTGPAADTALPPVMGDCAQTGFSSVNEIANIKQTAGSPNKYIIYQAHNAMDPPVDLISVEINANQLPPVGQVIDLAGMSNVNLANPQPVIVALASGCGAQNCSAVYFPESGTIFFEQLEETGKIVATLSEIRLVEVSIDQSTGQASPKPNGLSWCLPTWSINMDIKQPAELPVGGPAEATCVEAGTGIYAGDNVSNLKLQNCLGETVSLHDSCGQSKAHWMLGTAGWCTACDQLIASLHTQFSGANGIMSRASIAAAQPGLDMWIVLGEDNTNQLPTPAYCNAYAQGKGLDPAMVVIDHSVAGVNIPLVSPEGASIPAKSFAAMWSVINPYISANSEGMVQTAFPWNGILRGSNMEYVWSDYMGGDLNQVLNGLLSE